MQSNFKLQKMTTETNPEESLRLEIERVMQQAVALHQSGQLQLAEELYQAILQINQNHPDASHNFGMLTAQKNQPAAALPYLLTALNAEPERAQFWISYIDALIQTGQSEEAQQILTLARQQGLEGEEVDALVLRLSKQTDSACSLPGVLSKTATNHQKSPKAKSAKPVKSAKTITKKHNKHPSQQEIDKLTLLFNKNRYAEALTIAKLMTEHYPLHGFGWKALGAVHRQLEQNEEALSAMKKAAALLPRDAEAQNNLANTLRETGLLDEALTSYRKVLQINPEDTEAYVNLGVTSRALGRLEEAEKFYRQALKLKPDYPDAHNNLGNILKELGQFSAAEACYRQALKIQPRYAAAHNNLGALLKELGRLDEAVASFRQALALEANYPEALNNLGNALREQGHLAEALSSCQRALQIKPAYAEAHSNLAGVLKELGRLAEAETNCLQSLQINPDFVQAHNNLANIFQTQGKFEEAILSYRKILSLQPDYKLARINLGCAQLASGQLIEGWKNHEYRAEIDRKKCFSQPYWAGENLHGKSILIWAEQGIGDEIRFASQFTDIIAQAKHCIIECSAKLVPLFARSFPDAQVIPKSEPPHPATQINIDYQCAAGSLSQWLRPTLDSFPQQNIYLKPNAERVAYWKMRLAALGPGPKIGFSWRSSVLTGERSLYCTTLDQWGPIFSVAGVHFINLQYDECSTELAEAEKKFAVTLHNYTEVDMYNDLDETAALAQALDLVISAPTSVILMTAALGIATWVMYYGPLLASHGTDYVPWLPTLRCFNRRWDQPWAETIAKIAQQLPSHTWQSQTSSPESQQKTSLAPFSQSAHKLDIEGTPTQTGETKKNLDSSSAQTVISSLTTNASHINQPNPQEVSKLSELFDRQQYAEAATLARTITERFPLHGIGWKGLGTALILMGRNEEALLPLQKAAQLMPEDVGVYNNLGNTLQAMGHMTEAEFNFRHVLSINPSYAEAHCNLGNTLKITGRFNEAEVCYRRALQLKPDYAEAHNNLGNTLYEQGQSEMAEASFQEALRINPDFVEAYNNLATSLRKQGKLDEAIAICHKALLLNPAYAYAHYNMGLALQESARFNEAIASFHLALEIQPEFFDAQVSLGTALLKLKKLNEAETSLCQALKLRPDSPAALCSLGITLQEMNKLDDAASCFRQAININPDYAEAHNNLGNVLKTLGQLEDSVTSCQQALTFKPDFVAAYCNLGNALLAQGDFDAAIVNYHQTLVRQPDFKLAQVNLAHAQLASGKLTEGWKNYELRDNSDRGKHFHQPSWSGESLSEKSILIWREQGIGDEIRFASQYAEIIAQAKHCIIECSAKLEPLFARSFPGARIVRQTDPPHPDTQVKIDYQCAAGSLAQWLRPTLDSFPKQNIFIKPDSERVSYWKMRLAALGPGPKIGFSWRSSLMTGERPLYCTTLNQWGPIFNVDGVHFINLQYDECSAELEQARQQFGVPVHDFTEVDMYNDLDETAALAQALDLVISAPTSVTLMTAALGVATWVMYYGPLLISHGTDYIPWFPAMRCFSRGGDQSWDETILKIAQQLKSQTNQS